MTLTDDVRDQPATARPDASGAGISAGRSTIEGLADQAARVPWCWPALLTLALGLYQMGRPELWRDELASWSFATRPLSSMIATAHNTGATQFAYYLLLHFWIAAFGDSAAAMRIMSVLAMAAAAACVTLVGRKLAGARAGLIAGLVFALVPSISRFAQEVRFYAVEVLVATLATLLLLRALDGASVRRWAAYAASMTLLGYIDLVGLSLVAGHAAGAALRWRQDRNNRALWFVPAAFAALAACLPLAVIGATQAKNQITWIPKPGFDLTDFAFFGRNLFYGTSVAAALIILAVIAWSVAWREAAFVTAIAVTPVIVVWLVSQGPYSYFFPRYLLLTVAAWAILAGIGLSRLDTRVAVAAVCVIAVLCAGNQQVLRQRGAHSWPTYPVGYGGSYIDYAAAAVAVASKARAGDGIVYQGRQHQQSWLMIAYGLQYYLARDMRPGVPVPRTLFIAKTAAQAGALYPVPCPHPAACLGQEGRIWIVASDYVRLPYQALTPAQAALLRPHYHLTYHRYVIGLHVYLLVRDSSPGPARH